MDNYFGLLLTILRIASTMGSEYSCVASAICYMAQGNMHAVMEINKNPSQSSKAIAELKRAEDFLHCGLEKINEKCQSRKNRCEGEMVAEAKTLKLAQRLDLEERLLEECPPHTWFYMLFLCDTSKWTANVTSLIPKDYVMCRQSCHLMDEFNKYHLGKGVKKTDFPPDWEATLNATIAEPNFQIPTPRQAGSSRQIYTYVEYDEDAVGTNLQELVCPEGTWLGHTVKELYDFYSDRIPNVFSAYFRPFCVKEGQFLISAQFRRELKSYPIYSVMLQQLVEAQYLYGRQERTYTDLNNKPFRPTNFNGWGTPLTCPFTTAVCSLQVTVYPATGSPTNVKLGCCEVPLPLWGSITSYVVVGYNRARQGSATPFDRDITAATRQITNKFNGDLYKERKYFCPPGQFIDKFVVRTTWSKSLALTSSVNEKFLVFLETDFFCNTRDKTFPSRQIKGTGDLHTTQREFKRENIWYEMGTYSCPDGFFTESRVSIGKLWERSMHCSSNVGEYWSGGEWDYPGWPTTTNWLLAGYKGGEGIAACPPSFAFCGFEATPFIILPTNTRPYKLGYEWGISIEGYYYKYYCCKVENIDKCDNPKLTVPRLTSNCPTGRLTKETLCFVAHTFGSSIETENTTGTDTASKVAQSFGITASTKIMDAVTIGAAYSRTLSTTKGYSFSGVNSASVTTGETVLIFYTVPGGSKLVTAQPQLRCGPFLLRANQTIDYITPSITCEVRDEYLQQFPRSIEIPTKWGGLFNLTVRGFGMELRGELFPSPELNITWAELTEGLEQKFRTLDSVTNFDWRNADSDVFSQFDPSYMAQISFDIPDGKEPRFYQVVGNCGDGNTWTIRTKIFRMLIGSTTEFGGKLSNEDRRFLSKEGRPVTFFERINGVFVPNPKLGKKL